MITGADLAALRRDTDIVALLAERGVHLEAIDGVLRGTCPWCSSTEFSASASRGCYWCVACSRSGDAVRLVMDLDGLKFSEAVDALAGRIVGGVR
jgi:DNA primase